MNFMPFKSSRYERGHSRADRREDRNMTKRRISDEKSLRSNHRYARQSDHGASPRGVALENWPGSIKRNGDIHLRFCAPHRWRESSPCRSLKILAGSRPMTKSPFLGRQMQATFSDALLAARFNGAGDPIDGGPEIVGEEHRDRHALLQSGPPHYSTRSGPDQHPDDRCLQLPCQIAKNSDFFDRRRALQRSSDADRQPDRMPMS